MAKGHGRALIFSVPAVTSDISWLLALPHPLSPLLLLPSSFFLISKNPSYCSLRNTAQAARLVCARALLPAIPLNTCLAVRNLCCVHEIFHSPPHQSWPCALKNRLGHSHSLPQPITLDQLHRTMEATTPTSRPTSSSNTHPPTAGKSTGPSTATKTAAKSAAPRGPPVAPRIDEKPLYEALKTHVGLENWLIYKEALGGFLTGLPFPSALR